MFYNYEGKEVSADEWGKLFAGNNRRIAKDTIEEKFMVVSTVFIGLTWENENPPLIYETMVFPQDSFDELETHRWATREEAIQGHQHIVDKIKHG